MRVLVSCLLILAAAPVQAAEDIALTPNPDGPTVDMRTPAELEAARLARFRLAPISKAAAAKRDVRRVSYSEIFDPLSTPAVVFERMATGEVQLTVISNYGKHIDTATLKPEAWAYLTAKDAFALPRPGKPVTETEICHGSTAVIEATKGGKTMRYDAAVCNGPRDLLALTFARRLAGVAVDSIPRCGRFREKGRESSWVLGECMKRTVIPTDAGSIAGNDSNDWGEVTNFAISSASEVLENIPPNAATY